MTQLDREAIAQKLSRMVDRLDRLIGFEAVTLEIYLANEDYQDIIERQLELLIQSAVDINKTLLKRVAGIRPSESANVLSNFDSFLLMGAHGFLPTELSDQLAPSGSFRNILAHEYDDIDPNQVYAAFQKALIQYPQYVRAIQTYLDTL
ncbi:DUF86 domain-containing protein [Nodosilinea sp. P-1105]|uniref:type VII toxin-antitoxin system HepT family RNase toxin n=1 Tax=Nodosilinea sp. P-1105 TaxID=2546229 RepID=UPI00146BF185|nr:DUF86 domain-containing protein [Nodosilinea sp. P-1105]NMF81795.1 DUF86 domain-containing protein [Nodosilinea sp. P-1105]